MGGFLYSISFLSHRCNSRGGEQTPFACRGQIMIDHPEIPTC